MRNARQDELIAAGSQPETEPSESVFAHRYARPLVRELHPIRSTHRRATPAARSASSSTAERARPAA